jgi:hypothetical protein
MRLLITDSLVYMAAWEAAAHPGVNCHKVSLLCRRAGVWGHPWMAANILHCGGCKVRMNRMHD